MGCSCSKGRRSAGAPKGTTFVYDYYATASTPEEEKQVYSTALEAKTALRRAGGGVIKRRQVVLGTAA